MREWLQEVPIRIDAAMTDEFGAVVRSYRTVINTTRREPRP